MIKKVSYVSVEKYKVDATDASNLSGKYDLFKLDVDSSGMDFLTSLDSADFLRY